MWEKMDDLALHPSSFCSYCLPNNVVCNFEYKEIFFIGMQKKTGRGNTQTPCLYKIAPNQALLFSVRQSELSAIG